jgi:GTP pyrophosphokinase
MQFVDDSAEKKEILLKYKQLLKALRPNTTLKQKRTIRKAFDLAFEAHKDMRRKSGEPYIYHPLEVAHIVASEIGLGTTSVICSLLHDVVEDTDYTLKDMEDLFGEKVAKIIDGLTKISGIFDHSGKNASLQAENFRKILLTLSDDVRVILIKLADRLHNMRTLDSMPAAKQLKISSETRYLYAPLAHRLGLYEIKSELEDLALKYTEPAIYKTITLKLKESEEERQHFIRKFIKPIEEDLAKTNLKVDIQSRKKSINSIWNKMKSKSVPFEEIYDIFAVRIIVDIETENEKSACWHIYSIITDHYRPNMKRLRDWISIPKANGYEALHTTVMSDEGKWVEVQIRSIRMNEIAEKGYAAHWKYKENESSEANSLDEWLIKVKELLRNPEENALDFLDEFKLNLFTKEIYVFTPKGELKTMPIGASALDFAYNIHSQIGHLCIGAKINHKLVPLSYRLKTGDQVEIITSKKQQPKEEWLDFVITARAKSQIKQALKEERKHLVAKGAAKYKEFCKKLRIQSNKDFLDKLVIYTSSESVADLYVNIEKNLVQLKDIRSFSKVYHQKGWMKYFRRTNKIKEVAGDKKDIDAIIKEKLKENKLVLGETDNLSYKIAPCCNPIPGDDVIGYVNQDGEIEIHRTRCPNATNLLSTQSDKIVKAKWRDKQPIAFLSGIKIIGRDKLGIVNEITKVISSQLNVNMRTLNIETKDDLFEGTIMLYVFDTKQLDKLIGELRQINNIQKVSRIS